MHERLLVRHQSAFHPTESQTEMVADPEQREFNSNLGNLHQVVLSRIRSRHSALCDRAAAWENYRTSLAELLAWLDAAERERKLLVFRQIQEQALPMASHRVEVLLDKISRGHAIHDEVEKASRLLLDKLGADSSAVTVRADLKQAAARLTDLEAGLCSWRDFLKRVARLFDSLGRGMEAIRKQLQTVQADLVSDNQLPKSTESAMQLLQTYRVIPVYHSFISDAVKCID